MTSGSLALLIQNKWCKISTNCIYKLKGLHGTMAPWIYGLFIILSLAVYVIQFFSSGDESWKVVFFVSAIVTFWSILLDGIINFVVFSMTD